MNYAAYEMINWSQYKLSYIYMTIWLLQCNISQWLYILMRRIYWRWPMAVERGVNRTAETFGIQDSLIKSIKRSRQHSRKAPALLHPLSSVSTSRPSCNIDRIFSVGIDRSTRHSPRKRLPGEGKVIDNTCPRGYRHVADALSFYGSCFFFMGIGCIHRWPLREEQLSNGPTVTEYRTWIYRTKNERDKPSVKKYYRQYYSCMYVIQKYDVPRNWGICNVK